MKNQFPLFFISLFFFWINSSFAITPHDVVWRANRFANLHWYCDTNNTVSSHDPTYQSEFTVGWHYGEAYKWGGYDDESGFTTKIDNGYAAGYAHSDGVVDWACGIDCSGLVSRCWALAWKYGTYALDDISWPITWDPLEEGDILLRPGNHVVIFDHWIFPGESFWGIDASVSVNPARVSARNFEKATLQSDGYSPKRYKHFIEWPDSPPGGWTFMTWGQIKAIFGGQPDYGNSYGLWSYGVFSGNNYADGVFHLNNRRELLWGNIDPMADGYVVYRSEPTNSDYSATALGTGYVLAEGNGFRDSSRALIPMDVTSSDYGFSDTIISAAAPYFYRVASYIGDPFALNIYSDEIYTKAVGVGIDSFASFSSSPGLWTPRLDLATINNRDYLFLPDLSSGPTAIWDVTDLQNRHKVGEIWSYNIDVAVKDTLCFLVKPWGGMENMAVLTIWNVADPNNPIYLNWLIIDEPYPDGYYPLKVEVGNETVFILCTAPPPYTSQHYYVIKVDVSDPTNPVEDGIIEIGDLSHIVSDMVVSEPYIYVSRQKYGLRIYDCESLNLVCTYPFPPVDTLTYHSIDYQNGMLYAIKGSLEDGHVFLDAVDVSNPEQCALVMSRYIGDNSYGDPGFVHVQGNYLYLGTWVQLSIYDISDSLRNVVRLIPGYDWWPGETLPFFNGGEVVAKQDKVFGTIAQGACDAEHPHCFSGFYTVQTFGLETEVILIGDANSSGSIQMGDVSFLLNYLYKGGPRPFPYSLGEVNGDGVINIGDVCYLLDYLFRGGPPPAKLYVGPSEYQASLSFGELKANTEGVFEVPILCEANGPVAGIHLGITCDAGRIELLPPELSSEAGGLDLFYTEDCRQIGLLDLTGKSLVPTGPIISLKFRNKQPSGSELPLKIDEAILADPGGRVLRVDVLEDLTSASTKPKEFQLSNNYPNPFNPTTVIGYTIASDCNVKLVVYNVLGQKVRTLVDCRQEAGHKKVIWDGNNDHGVEVASGIYFYRLEAEEFSDAKKMIIIK
jgi:hypothetical protein